MSDLVIVEDDFKSRYYLKNLLEAKGYRVIAAENGKQALEHIRLSKPDLIISDIMMPTMNGFRLCREVKQDSALKDIPFVFYTATFVEKEDEELAMSLGASRYIVKPVEVDTFLHILNDVLNDFNQHRLAVPGTLVQDKQNLLQMYDTSMNRKLEEKIKMLREEKVALEISERRLHEAQQISHIGHWELNLRDQVLHWSDEVFRILGVKPGQFTPSYDVFLEAVHPEDRPRVRQAYQASLEKKTAYHIQHRLLLRDDQIKSVCSKCQTQYDDSGRPLYLIGTIQDITEQIQAQKERDEVLRRLSLANARLEKVIYVTCHDLRSPLVNIEGFASELFRSLRKTLTFLEDRRVPGDIAQTCRQFYEDEIFSAMEIITANARKMSHLLSGLNNYCRIGTETPTIKPLDMNGLMTDLLRCMQYQIDQSGVVVTTGELPGCVADESMLNRVFTNLIVNAIRYREPSRKGLVHISGQSEGGMSVYCVEDNGIGIAPEYQERIFEIFHRLNPQGAIPGEGLGLSIAAHILEIQQGGIRVESEQHKGSRFYVSLPGS